ncbi:hypothetical protein FISHEDRAFT_58536 [Fistulina hepatica ATCC 64428]|uniref:Uncharacterized protein n=1 Tax=Fistulina hepatica ATCC 64428 TaxID=1128425 RepID=A0A0D7AGN1_9AGAR|nr:hypothetical protein FISHEDRAFT_58536 [Fistulina hepatica ATCC 64428]
MKFISTVFTFSILLASIHFVAAAYNGNTFLRSRNGNVDYRLRARAGNSDKKLAQCIKECKTWAKKDMKKKKSETHKSCDETCRDLQAKSLPMTGYVWELNDF